MLSEVRVLKAVEKTINYWYQTSLMSTRLEIPRIVLAGHIGVVCVSLMQMASKSNGKGSRASRGTPTRVQHTAHIPLALLTPAPSLQVRAARDCIAISRAPSYVALPPINRLAWTNTQPGMPDTRESSSSRKAAHSGLIGSL